MSYDFHLVPELPGLDALAHARSLQATEAEEINPGPLVPEKEARKKRLAAALIRENPDLEPFLFDFARIAQNDGIPEAEVKVKYRHIELNGPADGNGIQIILLDDTADITVPYWHPPAAAAVVFQEIWRYLGALVREGGFAVYDPQLDRLLDLSADRERVIEAYGRVVARMPRTATHSAPPPRETRHE